MVGIFGIDAPNIRLPSAAIQYRADSAVRRQHGVVLIVVAVHAVSTDGIEIREPVQICTDRIELAVSTEVSRVGLRDANQSAVDDIAAIDEADFLQFRGCKFDEPAVFHGPKVISLAAE